MIVVDETDPVGENESPFPARDVKFNRGKDAKEFYNLISEIGRGKFGTVYKCQEKNSNLQVAAKFVPIPNRGDRRSVEREVEIMNSLRHHLIIQLYDAFEYQKMMCVVLELIEGGELFERVIDDDFILTERACVVFVRQICEAMEFVHRKQILHLDLKPENILCLTRTGNRIKLIDFGLARQFDPEKKLQVLFGTPEFCAPEVVNFDSISYGTDMWSVGVICYVLLSGLSPFMGETDIETMANVTISKYDFDDEAFNNVSTDAIDFITKLLMKEQEARMSATECLEHKWLSRSTSKGHRPAIAPKPVISNHRIISSRVADEDEKAEAPPPLPLSPPPPLDFLIESSTPLIIPPATSAEKIEERLSDRPIERMDTALDITKDNLKSFLERREEKPSEPYLFNNESHFIAPERTDNDSISLVIPNHSQGGGIIINSSDNVVVDEILNHADTMEEEEQKEIDDVGIGKEVKRESIDNVIMESNNGKTSLSDLDPATNSKETTKPRNAITKNLLEQLDLIQIPDKAADNHNVCQTNGSNNSKYLQVTNHQSDKNLNGESQFSSRGCSPSPCESLTSSLETVDRQAEIDTFDQYEDKDNSAGTHPPGQIGQIEQQPNQMLDEYLHSFDRRKSDSNYMLNNNRNPNKNVEKLDLVDEIRRLSDHLMLLNSLKEDINENKLSPTEDHVDESLKNNGNKLPENGKLKAIEMEQTTSSPSTVEHQSSSIKPPIKEKPQHLMNKIESKTVRSQVMKFSSTNERDSGIGRSTSTSFVQTQTMTFNGKTSSSVRTATKQIEENRQITPQMTNTPPWMMKCKRTKFRISEMSRDVPLNAPNSHQNIFIEEAATTTKDCLLHLLEKYNHNNETTSNSHSNHLPPPPSRVYSSSSSSSSSVVSSSSYTTLPPQKPTNRSKLANNGEEKRLSFVKNFEEGEFSSSEFIKSMPRHHSLSLDWQLNNNLEQHSMNSINTFFQQHSSRVGSSLVKQIQRQIEGKNH